MFFSTTAYFAESSNSGFSKRLFNVVRPQSTNKMILRISFSLSELRSFSLFLFKLHIYPTHPEEWSHQSDDRWSYSIDLEDSVGVVDKTIVAPIV